MRAKEVEREIDNALRAIERATTSIDHDNASLALDLMADQLGAAKIAIERAGLAFKALKIPEGWNA